MKSIIETTIQHDTYSTKIKIDNSTNYKDFTAVNIEKENVKERIGITLSSEGEDGEKTLIIGKTSLKGIEVDLFKEFINQSI